MYWNIWYNVLRNYMKRYIILKKKRKKEKTPQTRLKDREDSCLYRKVLFFFLRTEAIPYLSIC